MKVLWCCNVVLPELADAAGIADKAHSAGWIEGFLKGIKQFKEVELGIICPHKSGFSGTTDGIRYWLCSSCDYKKILDDFKPDVVHIFGTENEESNKLINIFGQPEKTVINIQGIAGLISDVYVDGLPPKMQLKQRVFEGCIKNGLLNQRDRLRARSITEKDSLQKSGHVIGRTDIDRMFALNINPNIHYHHCNEILRKNFYEAEHWDITNIKRHSIMIRSTGNPLKGLHQMLYAMPHILKKYPDAHLYVLGSTFSPRQKPWQRFTEGSYNKLIRETVEKLGLANHITALSTLDSKQMEQLYLQTHVVVSASVIENESNVVSEAKLLGVPVVASFVGGLPNRITHGYDGYLYPYNMPEMLAYYVTEIFNNDNLARQISQNAIRTQLEINNPEKNIATLVEIYKNIEQKN